jgi:SH3-like domain-containing protein
MHGRFMKNDTVPLTQHGLHEECRVPSGNRVTALRAYHASIWPVFLLLVIIALLVQLLLASSSGFAQEELTVGRSTGLPVPRFVSVDSDESEVYVRFGPGQQYPINWVFTRPGVPLEIVAEFDNWRKIKDFEGAEGWIAARLLSGQRTIMIQGKVRDIRRRADNRARVLLRAEPGVIGDLLECQDSWCRVEIEGQRGWLQRDDFWGTLPGELYP